MVTNRIQSQLEVVVAQVFERLPALVGFSIDECAGCAQDGGGMQLDRELVLSNVETYPWMPFGNALVGEIAVPLIELMDERPDARELLRGRTFARVLQ